LEILLRSNLSSGPNRRPKHQTAATWAKLFELYGVCYFASYRSFMTVGVGLTMTILQALTADKVTTVVFGIIASSWRDLDYGKSSVRDDSIY
jgi:hypothetical protein